MDYDFRDCGTTRRVPVVELMLNTKLGPIGQTVSKFQLLVNFSFSSAAILDYEFCDFVTTVLFRVRSRRYRPNLVHIGRTVQKIFNFQ